MTAISAASVNVRTMADGTLRITFDIEPSEAGAAFALFGKPGTPAALAALAVGYAAKTPEVTPQVTPEVKGGPLSKEAAMLCRNPVFLRWLVLNDPENTTCSEADAADQIRDQCGIESRAELDADERAGAYFINHFRTPFIRWQRETKAEQDGQAVRP